MLNACVIPWCNNSCSIFNGLCTLYKDHCCLLILIKEACMDKNELKKFLAGLSLWKGMNRGIIRGPGHIQKTGPICIHSTGSL